MEECVVTPPLP